MAFNPPADPTAGAQYTYGNVTWEFDGAFGVWNITDGTIVGGVGPPGPVGPVGPAGPIGPPGVASSIPIASYSVTGTASFYEPQFTISATGNVQFKGGTGDQVQAGSFIQVTGTKIKTITNMGVRSINGITGPITFTTVSPGGISITTTPTLGGGGDLVITNDLYNNVVTSLNGEVGAIRTGPTGSLAYRHTLTGRLTGSSEFLYGGGDGAHGGLTFTSNRINISNSSLSMTVTGPNIIIGQSTQVTGGVFTNPAEKSVKYTLADNVNDIVINGLSGTIQRYVVNPSGTITVKCGSSWRNVAGDTETIAVMVHSLKGNTGTFDGNIISGNPVLFGVTGGLEMFTIMRVSIDGTNGLTMGLQVANGLTGKNFNF